MSVSKKERNQASSSAFSLVTNEIRSTDSDVNVNSLKVIENSLCFDPNNDISGERGGTQRVDRARFGARHRYPIT